MKQPIKNEADVLGLISKMQVQLFAIDQKLNMLITRIAPGTKLPQAAQAPAAVALPAATPKPHDHHNNRPMHTAICADCNKECTIPFKPSKDRPVYCQECFSRRKSGHVSKITNEDKPKESVSAPMVVTPVVEASKIQIKKKKKVTAVKKSVTKKKPAPKKGRKK